MSRTVKAFFDAFKRGDVVAMLTCLFADVAHHVNEGKLRRGEIYRQRHMS